MMEKITGPDGFVYAVISEDCDGVEWFYLERLCDYWQSVESWSTRADAVAALASEIAGPGIVAPEFEQSQRAMALACVLKTRAIDEPEIWAKYQKLCERRRLMPIWGQLRRALGYLLKAGAVKLVEEKTKIIRA